MAEGMGEVMVEAWLVSNRQLGLSVVAELVYVKRRYMWPTVATPRCAHAPRSSSHGGFLVSACHATRRHAQNLYSTNVRTPKKSGEVDRISVI